MDGSAWQDAMPAPRRPLTAVSNLPPCDSVANQQRSGCFYFCSTCELSIAPYELRCLATPLMFKVWRQDLTFLEQDIRPGGSCICNPPKLAMT